MQYVNYFRTRKASEFWGINDETRATSEFVL